MSFMNATKKNTTNKKNNKLTPLKQITSTQNPLIKTLQQLQEKAKLRKQNQSFVVEGKREILKLVVFQKKSTMPLQ